MLQVNVRHRPGIDQVEDLKSFLEKIVAEEFNDTESKQIIVSFTPDLINDPIIDFEVSVLVFVDYFNDRFLDLEDRISKRIEQFSKEDTFVTTVKIFIEDKTGSLTEGMPEVSH